MYFQKVSVSFGDWLYFTDNLADFFHPNWSDFLPPIQELLNTVKINVKFGDVHSVSSWIAWKGDEYRIVAGLPKTWRIRENNEPLKLGHVILDKSTII